MDGESTLADWIDSKAKRGRHATRREKRPGQKAITLMQ